MTASLRSPRAELIASVPLGGADILRLTMERVDGRAVVDLRVFKPFTPAKVLMPTKASLQFAASALPELIAGLQAALRSCVGVLDDHDN